MILTDCQSKTFSACEVRVFLKRRSVCQGSRRKLDKSAVVQGFRVVL